MEWTLEIVLVGLLGATLFQAIRLERALGVLKRDRASLEALIQGFNASTSQAESGIQQLRAAADGTGRQIESQVTKSVSLKDDLTFLTERGDRLADRLEALVRSARPLAETAAQERAVQDRAVQDGTGQDRTVQDRIVKDRPAADPTPRVRPGPGRRPGDSDAAALKPASLTERDLLQALRLAR